MCVCIYVCTRMYFMLLCCPRTWWCMDAECCKLRKATLKNIPFNSLHISYCYYEWVTFNVTTLTHTLTHTHKLTHTHTHSHTLTHSHTHTNSLILSHTHTHSHTHTLTHTHSLTLWNPFFVIILLYLSSQNWKKKRLLASSSLFVHIEQHFSSNKFSPKCWPS